MKDIIITAITVLLIVFIAVALINDSSRGIDLQEINSNIEIETSAYRQEKKQLTEELDSLMLQKEKKTKGIACLLLTFVDVNEQFADEIVPLLDNNNCVATLCINETVLKGENDYLSLNEVKELESKGWQTAVFWDGEETYDDWFRGIRNAFLSAGEQIPEVICLDTGYYDVNLDDAFVNSGFNTAIICADNRNDFIDDKDSRIKKINGFPWYTTEGATSLSANDYYNSQLAFFVGVVGEELAYETYQFSAMFNSAIAKQGDSKLVITTPKGSLEQLEMNREELETSADIIDARIEEIKLAIAELDKKINSVYESYN